MLLSEIEFGAFLTYSPNGADEVAEESRRWVLRIKEERLFGTPPRPTSEIVAERLRARLSETGLAELLSSKAILVPAPRSALLQANQLWPARVLATALVRFGLGESVLPCLRRSSPVPKAATSKPELRPTAAQHYASMATTESVQLHDEFVVVDDVVTRGATLLAAVSRLKEALPSATIRGFAVIRTMSSPTEFHQMFAPCVGKIRLNENGQTTRRP